ncbi:hypothetical protein SHJG_p1097 (plasmid) [Streptomyces hygroscopicus subsp. jinggangensis 5008]|nr:hypothetical protein SHJG_p1097 [Streptomyces hygroscopicus subsp. jinggangensis 5008]AGF68382.1 hypothetical protein SHJGH_p1097 [Streptomyces hygroscopicus subsp. jinggangensis TL01]
MGWDHRAPGVRSSGPQRARDYGDVQGAALAAPYGLLLPV